MWRNPSEAIVDRDNHLRDCAKYIVLSLPCRSEIPVKSFGKRLWMVLSRTALMQLWESSWRGSESKIGEVALEQAKEKALAMSAS